MQGVAELAKRTKPPPAPSAREKTVTRQVAHPELHFTEAVEYVRSPVDYLRGKQKLDPYQVAAAEKYRGAWELLQSSPGGAMDFERVRGGGAPGSPPAVALLAAADILAEAAEVLGRHVLVIDASVGFGYSVAETAARLYRKVPSRSDIEFIGRLIRECLSMLAVKWGQGKNTKSQHRILSLYRPFSAIPVASEAVEGPMKVGGTAHAGPGKKVVRR